MLKETKIITQYFNSQTQRACWSKVFTTWHLFGIKIYSYEESFTETPDVTESKKEIGFTTNNK